VAVVLPFRGLRYNLDRIWDVSSVISPPYDVVSREEQGLFQRKSPYNIVRIELGEELQGDTAESNKYTRAGDTIRRWLRDGILVRDPLPAFYVLRHQFAQQGLLTSRWGLIGRVRLDEQGAGQARAHEVVMESRVRDRLSLMRHCRANVSSILGMVREDSPSLVSVLNYLVSEVPDLSAVDDKGVIHSLWVITDEASNAQVSEWFADKAVYIADGHHRYETALAYRRGEVSALQECTGDEAYNYVMMTLADASDPGLVALSAHRLVRLDEPLDAEALAGRLEEHFHLEYLEPVGGAVSDRMASWVDALEVRGKRGLAIGVYGMVPGRLCVLTPRDGGALKAMLPPERSPEWKDLDVAVLHWVVLRQILGIDTDEKQEEHVRYSQDVVEVASRVDSGEFQLGFLLNPVPLDSILAVADAGERMPPKSTYFYPKLPTGLVMHPLWEDDRWWADALP